MFILGCLVCKSGSDFCCMIGCLVGVEFSVLHWLRQFSLGYPLQVGSRMFTSSSSLPSTCLIASFFLISVFTGSLQIKRLRLPVGAVATLPLTHSLTHKSSIGLTAHWKGCLCRCGLAWE
ncbi:uncharacterized protein EI90DRAFT_2141682 [Cantharellus anzutake]|uniref:uncharacterized protein n=1 Tax=Cantharellus anzutake TaxID=1750568 RepID=UPI0019089FF3|nr:uncharacterized protein EI90DRAFT_2141682 [Cantharellus anzutake]KAF8325446.1 hypothetical protein EI90DRAFT_2141682 [Cantharellus anzutake]